MINFPLLTSEDIEVKVKQITKSGALLLLYKTARTDAKVLDAAVGPMNWTCDYEEVHGNLFCRVGIREDETKDFVYKSDCGTESEQDDGNEKKAEASDSFKRSCSRWGIGRELYTSPLIWADVATEQQGSKFVLKDKYAKYVVTDIQYNEDTRVITKLEISNAKTGTVVFSWTMPTSGAMAKKMVKTITEESVTPSETNEDAPQDVSEETPTTNSTEEKTPLKTLIQEIGIMVKSLYTNEGNTEKYQEIINKVKPGFKCNVATEEDYDIVLTIYNSLKEILG